MGLFIGIKSDKGRKLRVKRPFYAGKIFPAYFSYESKFLLLFQSTCKRDEHIKFPVLSKNYKKGFSS